MKFGYTGMFQTKKVIGLACKGRVVECKHCLSDFLEAGKRKRICRLIKLRIDCYIGLVNLLD